MYNVSTFKCKDAFFQKDNIFGIEVTNHAQLRYKLCTTWCNLCGDFSAFGLVKSLTPHVLQFIFSMSMDCMIVFRVYSCCLFWNVDCSRIPYISHIVLYSNRTRYMWHKHHSFFPKLTHITLTAASFECFATNFNLCLLANHIDLSHLEIYINVYTGWDCSGYHRIRCWWNHTLTS